MLPRCPGSVLWQHSDMLHISGFMDYVIFAHKIRLLDFATRLRQWGSHAAMGLVHRNTRRRQWTLGTTSCSQGLLGCSGRVDYLWHHFCTYCPCLCNKGKGSPYSITEHRVQALIPVVGSQHAGDMSHKPGGRLPLLFTRPAVILATRKRAATSFAAWWTQAQWVWTVCLRLLPNSVMAAIWTQALLHLSPAR